MLQTKNLCDTEAQTIVKHTVATLKKMWKEKNCYLFWEDLKQKATKLDVDAPKWSRKRRAAATIEEFFGEKVAPEHANDVILTKLFFPLSYATSFLKSSSRESGNTNLQLNFGGLVLAHVL